ncbi:glycosyltransferase family 4 protein [Selenomonas sp.]|uniref:glycosyltransferase family 4 protein n=1 Tax=Selenomonas sp. TaxID=2053611 RepID=UPI002A75DF40|nr:glycosyltransferase family 4 protein [Selenomonas sp.]MDY3296698.1 glycosyltransferase family 4 protein [Selenomonas sp.]
MKRFMGDDVVIGFVDNRATDIGTFEDKPVYLPTQAKDVPFDGIVLMSVSFLEMRDQLLELGIPRKKIFFWKEYQARRAEQERQVLLRTNLASVVPRGNRILVVSVELTLAGGALAICYAAEELARLGYDVTLAAPEGDAALIGSLRAKGVNVVMIPGLMFCEESFLRSHMQYEVALVNVFLNIRLAYLLSKYIPTLWWIHEPGARYAESLYPLYQKMFPEFDTPTWMSRVRITTVTRKAKEIFEAYYPAQVDALLLLGEEGPGHVSYEWRKGQPVRVAIIGGVREVKGQDIFLEAIQKMSDVRRRAEFLLIGSRNETSDFGQHVAALAEGIPQVSFCGTIARAELMELFPTFDVIICASREETLSMAIVEGMMHGKVCITTDATGIAELIEDGRNGYIVPVEDVDALSSCMEDVIAHYDELDAMRRAARATYERYFTMEAFGDRLEREIEMTMQEWKVRNDMRLPAHG